MTSPSPRSCTRGIQMIACMTAPTDQTDTNGIPKPITSFYSRFNRSVTGAVKVVCTRNVYRLSRPRRYSRETTGEHLCQVFLSPRWDHLVKVKKCTPGFLDQYPRNYSDETVHLLVIASCRIAWRRFANEAVGLIHQSVHCSNIT